MTDQHLDLDDLIALALQWDDPAERVQLAEHVTTCAQCRSAYAAVEDDVQRVLAATPPLAPPAGFSGRTLAAMGISDSLRGTLPTHSPSEDGIGVTRVIWRPMAAACAALVLGIVLGVGATLALLQPEPPAAVVPAASSLTGPLLTASGEEVGTASVLDLGGHPHLIVTVTGAAPNSSYECVVVSSAGERHTVGSWTLPVGQHGAGGTWMVELPGQDLDRMELVGPSGYVWAEVEF